jgi:STE24 endopeptidase
MLTSQGLVRAKRVVFYDTLLRQLSAPEVEAVLAHELGHFKHKHIVQRMVLMFALSLQDLRCWVGCPPNSGFTRGWGCTLPWASADGGSAPTTPWP